MNITFTGPGRYFIHNNWVGLIQIGVNTCHIITMDIVVFPCDTRGLYCMGVHTHANTHTHTHTERGMKEFPKCLILSF